MSLPKNKTNSAALSLCLARAHNGRLSRRARVYEILGAPRRHWVRLAEHGNGPMGVARARCPNIPDRTPRTAVRIDHQLRAGGSAPTAGDLAVGPN